MSRCSCCIEKDSVSTVIQNKHKGLMQKFLETNSHKNSVNSKVPHFSCNEKSKYSLFNYNGRKSWITVVISHKLHIKYHTP